MLLPNHSLGIQHALPAVLAAARQPRSSWRIIAIAAGFVFVVFLILAAFGAYHAISQRRRTRSLQQIAATLGFEFFPDGDPQYLANLSPVPLFLAGRQSKLWNLLRGRSRSFEVTVFDYSYVTGSGGSMRTVQQTIVCLQTPALQLPDFTLAPKSFWDAVGSIFGHQNIEVDGLGHPIFSRSYVLRGSDPDAVRAVFSDNVLQFFDEHLGLNSQALGERILLYKAGQRTSPDEIPAFVEESLKLLPLVQASAASGA